MAGGQAGVGLAAPGTAPVEIAPVLWVAGDLAPVVDSAVPLCEEMLHDGKISKLRKAKIDPVIIRQIEGDFKWPDKSKVMLAKTGASLGAKWLNKAGISAVYKDEVNFGVALMIILKHEAALNRRLDKLIAAAEQAAASAKAAPAVPAAAPAPKVLQLDEAIKQNQMKG